MKSIKKNLLLYAVTSADFKADIPLPVQCEAAAKGGITMLQVREKELSYDDFLDESVQIKKICRKYNIPLIINDNACLARSCDADGLHIGQSDISVKEAREIIGNDKILGVSAQTVAQAVCAESDGADYLGVGSVFQTSTKTDADSVSLDTLKQICSSVSIPVVAIGGITKDNIYYLSGSGISGIAVVSAIFAAENTTSECIALKKEIERIVNL